MLVTAMRYRDFLDIGTASDHATFKSRLVSFAQNLDFQIVQAVLMIKRPSQPSVVSRLSNLPSDFAEASMDEADSRRDPVLQRLRTASVPFVYDQTTYVEAGAGDLWETQARYGFRTGISMSLHMPGGRQFLFGVDREQALPADERELMRLMADLQLLAVHAQETAARVMMPKLDSLPKRPKLTPREREVLQWTREGKSAWAIGQILSMSEHTVVFHLRNAMTKLEVSSKHSAVLKAMEIGLL
ncbi:helix-turn-helix transcriptional regulator [Rubrivivax benzoatilyticus]|nr:autoinducer binding domain-containing protein [Rubrivivax benzoatilyticus]EGJ10403.1 LuxR family transcriptional regulator [Rubrivivax benzoatilyticus JA2 = ATCC BAA-35]